MAMPANPPKARRTVTGLRLAVARRSLLLTDSKHARRASARFEQFLSTVVHRKLPELPAPACLIAMCAMAFDAVTCKGELLQYLAALRSLQTWGERRYATWESSGQTNRRAPSVFTLLSMRGVDLTSVDWTEVLEQVERALAACYDFAGPMPIGRRIQAVVDDGMAFLEHRLPRPLVAHLLGVLPQTALSSSAWERRYRVPTDKPASETPEEDLKDAPLAAISAAVVEGLYERTAPLSGSWFAQLLHEVCDGLIRPGVKLSNSRVREALIGRLYGLSSQLNEVGPVEALLLGWGVDIITFGSARKSHPAIKTYSNLWKPAVKRLHRALSSTRKHPLDLTVAEWSKIFSEILESDKDPRLRRALSSFQKYLVRTHDVDPLPWLFREPADVRVPRANVLWDHEFDALTPWVREYLRDERAFEQTRVWIALLRATGMRFSAVVHLKLSGIECKDGQPIRIAFAEALKTEAGLGIHEISEAADDSLIRSWVERRSIEACSRDELLFADPYEPSKVYRLGACYGAIARAMKRVTGDDEIVVHAIRHTFGSFEVERALRLAMTEFKEIRRLDQIRVRMGHADFRTTFVTYCHLFEDLLRDCIDMMVQRIDLRPQDAAIWTLDPGADPKLRDEELVRRAAYFRQKKHRISGWSAWAVLCATVQPAAVQRSDAPMIRGESTACPKSLTLDDVKNIASDWCAGMEISRIVLRSGHGSVTVDAVVNELESGCTHVRAARHARGPHPSDWREWFGTETNLSRLAAPRWARAIRSLGTLLAKAHPPAVGRWLQACAGIGIDAGHASLPEVLRFLQQAGFGVEGFVIRTSDRTVIDAVSNVFSDVFADCAQVELVAARGGKPGAYVQVLTRAASGDRPVPAATSDMKTLRGLLLAGAAYQNVLLNQDESK